jgi:hypothetical protein
VLGCNNGFEYFHSNVSTLIQAQKSANKHLSCSGRSSLSPGFNYLALVMETGIDIYDVQAKIPAVPLRSKGGLQSPVLFVHNGEAIAGDYRNGHVRLWTRHSGTRLQTLQHSSKPYNFVLWSMLK